MAYRLKNSEASEHIKKALEELNIDDRETQSYLRQIMVTAGKLGNDGAHDLDLKIITNSLKEIRYAFQIFQEYRDERKISVFGSARTPPDDPRYEMAQEFSSQAADKGYYLISGGGPGIMEAVNRGAGRDQSFGLHILLPHEEQPNEYIKGDQKCIHFRYFFSRKLVFARENDAAVYFPGGFGTHDELFELLCLIQTGRQHLIPIVLCDDGSFWDEIISYLDQTLASEQTIDRSDLNLFDYASSPEEALEIIENFHSNYHSSRFLGENFIIRFQHLPSEQHIQEVEKRFDHICPESGFQVVEGALQNEEPSAPDDLYRLIFSFSRKHYGDLKKLVDFINSWT